MAFRVYVDAKKQNKKWVVRREGDGKVLAKVDVIYNYTKSKSVPEFQALKTDNFSIISKQEGGYIEKDALGNKTLILGKGRKIDKENI